MLLRFSSLLPGISAGARLGISELERGPVASSHTDQATARSPGNRPERDRLPPREDAFYLSLMHSHL